MSFSSKLSIATICLFKISSYKLNSSFIPVFPSSPSLQTSATTGSSVSIHSNKFPFIIFFDIWLFSIFIPDTPLYKHITININIISSIRYLQRL